MPLVLDSLEIKNFRAFKHLRIEKLGRVNLIVGKNNVGKSTVLEALWLYLVRGEPYHVNRLLYVRDELAEQQTRPQIMDAQEQVNVLGSLFHGHIDPRKPHEKIVIGSMTDVEDRVTIDVHWTSIQLNAVNEPIGVEAERQNSFAAFYPHLSVGVGANPPLMFSLNMIHQGLYGLRPELSSGSDVQVTTSGLDSTHIGVFWDNVALSDLEHDVISALRIVAPHVEAVNLVGGRKQNGERIVKVRMQGGNTPVTLRSMGEGMNRMFGIALALVNAKDGMLLIDEVDTGLHYSVLPDLWKLIFEVAHRLNVQVFATSHSWDCIEAFQSAAANNTEEEGVLVRLENRKSGVGAVTFDEQELAIVTRGQIEVR